MPVPATTPYWPAIVYVGEDGQSTTTALNAPFPTPPPSIGPDTPAPPTGSWPKRDILPYAGLLDQPTVPEYIYFDFKCVNNPWLVEDNGTSPESDQSNDDDDDEDAGKEFTSCPLPTSASSSSKIVTSTATVVQEPSLFETGNPELNKEHCYGAARIRSTCVRIRLRTASVTPSKTINWSRAITLRRILRMIGTEGSGLSTLSSRSRSKTIPIAFGQVQVIMTSAGDISLCLLIAVIVVALIGNRAAK